MNPFKCPHCGSHDYSIVLTGCTVTNATIQEAFTWDEEAKEYASSGSVIVDSDDLENETGAALCCNCEKDVSEEVSAYEQTMVPSEPPAEA